MFHFYDIRLIRISLFVLCACYLTGCSGSGKALYKNEQERPASPDDLPTDVIDLIEDIEFDVQEIRYFNQIRDGEEAYEVKITYNDRLYSLEFDHDGELEDIELLIDEEELPDGCRECIYKYLDQRFDRYKLTRIQLQFLPGDTDEDEFIEEILSGSRDDYEPRVEIEAEGQNSSELGFFELLFDSDGQLVSSRKILKRSLDNIW